MAHAHQRGSAAETRTSIAVMRGRSTDLSVRDGERVVTEAAA
jgi:hypothetical protein